MGRNFLDTNVVVYFATGDSDKAARAADLVAAGGAISVQVLSEFVDVAQRKMRLDWSSIDESLSLLRQLFVVENLTLETHEVALGISHRHKMRIYDSMIVASALLAECDTLYSEDMHHGLAIGGLRIINPFLA